MSGSQFVNPSAFDGAPMDWTAGVLPGTTQQVDPNAWGVAGSAGLALGTGTGQQGVELTATGMGGTVGNAIQNVWAWLNKPFTMPLSPYEVGLLVGIIAVAIIFWNLVIYHIRLAAETI